jgi:hypothetical protein
MSDKTLRLRAKVDEPSKEATIKVSATASVSDLRTAIAKATDLKSDVVARYTLFNVAFGYDVVAVGKKSENETLSDAGVRDNSVIFVRAPADIKPPKRRPKKKKKTDEKEEKGSVDKDRYKGLTAKTILKKIEELKETGGKKRKIYMEYVEIYAGEVVKHGFNKLKKDLLLEIIKSDRLNIKEVDLFEAVVGWGKEQLKEQKK